MNNENTKTTTPILFVDGMYSNEVSEKAPEWLLGSISVQPEKLAMWLQANLALKNEKGYINLTVKRSKAGKRFISVDTYKKPTASAPQPNTESEYTLADVYPEQPPVLDFDTIN